MQQAFIVQLTINYNYSIRHTQKAVLHTKTFYVDVSIWTSSYDHWFDGTTTSNVLIQPMLMLMSWIIEQTH
jgi:hypothetical protein